MLLLVPAPGAEPSVVMFKVGPGPWSDSVNARLSSRIHGSNSDLIMFLLSSKPVAFVNLY